MAGVRALSGSRGGRKHYVDLGSQLLDPTPTPSGEAVRGLLDEALARGVGAAAPRAAAQ